MNTTFASHALPRQWSSHQAVFAAILALAIAIGAIGVVSNSFDEISAVGVDRVGAVPNNSNEAFVEALASNYPPVEVAAAYRAAASATKADIDQAFADALASKYPPIEQAAAYRAAASATKADIDQAFADALASNYPPVELAAAYRAAAE